MNRECDVLIAGAGPAGCAAAYDLAVAGKRVLLLDKRSFPRHKACACGLTRKTLAALRYSVEPVVERVCREIVLQQAGGEPRHCEVRVRARKPICALAVRERFDEFCLRQTLAAGAKGGSVTLRKIESIVGLRESDGAVALDVAVGDGVETLTAAVMIGADGSNGQVRRLVGMAPEGQDGFALETTVPYDALPAAVVGAHDLVFDFAPVAGGYGWLFPKGDHVNIGIGIFESRVSMVRA